MLLAQARHELRHAFTLADARGYIYLEGSLNPYLLHLLCRIPGVVFRGNELVRTAIEKSELIKLLKAKPAVRSNFTQGQWVRVTRGVYKGDIGLIDSVHDWGAEVLLIPRIPTVLLIGRVNGKHRRYPMPRNCSTRLHSRQHRHGLSHNMPMERTPLVACDSSMA